MLMRGTGDVAGSSLGGLSATLQIALAVGVVDRIMSGHLGGIDGRPARLHLKSFFALFDEAGGHGRGQLAHFGVR